MSVFAVICEYNPFHNGHKYLIEQVKKDGDTVIAVMSGSFTQRGDVAVSDKFSRAETALRNGADLVIELPAVFAYSNAETFARGGVEIANSLNVVDKLCFGAEDADINLLKLAGEAFEDKRFKKELKKYMDSGEYYPRAVKKTLEEVYSPALASVVEKPNNILAVEYIKALSGTGIEPVAVKRIGAAHDSTEVEDNITSASNIREMIKSGKNFSPFVPNYTINNPADIKRLERIILYKLRTMSKEEIKKLPDVSEGLENRIYDAARSSKSLDELFEAIKTKRYTMARIRRIAVSALLNIKSEDSKTSAKYIRVLAFNEKGAHLLSQIKEKGSLPLITNVADGYNSLNDDAKKMFDIDILATDTFNMALSEIKACGEDFTKGVIKLW